MAVSRAAFSGISGTPRGRNLQAWAPTALGGSITDAGGFRIHTFNTGTSNFQVVSGLSSVEYLVLAGGGGGSHWVAGGGGAGGLLTGTSFVIPTTYSIVAGAGGRGSVAGTPGPDTLYTNESTPSSYGQKGFNSTAFGLTTFGGGTGPGFNSTPLSSQINGGSGAGSRYQDLGVAGLGVAGQGNKGGETASNHNGNGGGGGAGSAGGDTPNTTDGGAGGSGLSNSISGSSLIYAAGGGGAAGSGVGGAGGSSGVGGFGTNTTTPGNGLANRGSGGGSNNTTTIRGGNGSDGVVIIRYSLG